MKRLGQNLLLIVAGSLAGVLVMELGLRLAGISFPLFYQYDPWRGSALRPGARGYYHGEGNAFVSINSDGLRDREHARVKPPRAYRIAVIGDSFAEALQVDAAATFWAVMEREAGACPALAGKTVEALNFGSSGYGTAQEYLTLREHAMGYSPDLVLVAFSTSSDLRDNARALGGDGDRPYFVYRDGQLVLDDSFRDGPRFRRGNSPIVRALHALNNSIRVLQVGHELWVRSQGGGGSFTVDVNRDPSLAAELYREPRDAAWQQAWQVTEGLLARMNDEARRGGARLVVTTLTTPIQVNPDPEARLLFAGKHDLADLDYVDRRVFAAGRRDGYAVWNLAPALRARAEKDHLLLHGFRNATLGFGHWNLDGHRLAGTELATRLCALLTSDP